MKVSLTLLAMFSLVACGGAGGEEAGKESLPISKEQSQEKVQELANTDGFYLEFTFSSGGSDSEETSGSFSYGKSGDVLWMRNQEGQGFALKKAETLFHAYEYNLGDEETPAGWEYLYSVSDEEKAGTFTQAFEMTYNTWLYYGNAYDGYLTKGSDTTVAGRSCYTYSFDMNSLTQQEGISGIASQYLDKLKGVEVRYEIAVDKELGITMKLSVSGSAEGESGYASFEVTKFVTGSSVEVPDLPEPTNINDVSSQLA